MSNTEQMAARGEQAIRPVCSYVVKHVKSVQRQKWRTGEWLSPVWYSPMNVGETPGWWQQYYKIQVDLRKMADFGFERLNMKAYLQ
jgi:hypothetical protein